MRIEHTDNNAQFSLNWVKLREFNQCEFVLQLSKEYNQTNQKRRNNLKRCFFFGY